MDGSPLPGKVKYSRSRATLEIPNFQQEDEGFYACTAGNLRGRNLAKGQLVFHGEPTVRGARDTPVLPFLVTREGR